MPVSAPMVKPRKGRTGPQAGDLGNAVPDDPPHNPFDGTRSGMEAAMDGIETLLAIGGLIIGGFGALSTAVSAYLLGRRKLDQVRVTSEQKNEIEEQRLEIQRQRIDLSHHESIVQGYKDLLEQYKNARDLSRNEVHVLRNDLATLTGKVEVMTRNHAKCEAENAELKAALTAVTDELKAVRDELAELRTGYQPSTSAAPETPTTAA